MDHLRSSQGPRRSTRFSELNERICDLVEDFGLVSFETLAVEDKRSMLRLQRVLDKATGYVYVEKEGQQGSSKQEIKPGGGPLRDVKLPNNDDTAMAAYEPSDATRRGTAASAAALFTVADRGEPIGWGSAADVQERWVDHQEDWKDFEIKERREMEDRWTKAGTQVGEGSDAAAMGAIKERKA